MEDINYKIDAKYPDYTLILKFKIERNKLTTFFHGMQVKSQKLKGINFADMETKEYLDLPKESFGFVHGKLKGTLGKVELKIKIEKLKPLFKFATSEITGIQMRKANDKFYEVKINMKGLYNA